MHICKTNEIRTRAAGPYLDPSQTASNEREGREEGAYTNSAEEK